MKFIKKNLDEICCRYVNSIFEAGFDLQDATKTLAAVIDSHCDFGHRDRLPRTRRALQGWAKVEPQRTRPPIPWSLVCLLVVTMVKNKN